MVDACCLQERGKVLNEKTERISWIDQYRGFAILSMILVNFIADYNVPQILQHSKHTGLTFADIVAPLFMFIIGLMYRRSYLKRVLSDGKLKTMIHFINRYTLLIVIGLAINSIVEGSFVFEWGVLQTIGLAGIIVLPFIGSSYFVRGSLTFLLLFTYQLFLLPSFKELILNMAHGGPIAAISWSGIILLASIAGDLIDFNKTKETIKRLMWLGLSVLVIGIIFSLLVLISKEESNASYIIVTTGISTILLVVFIYINDILKFSIPTLTTLGKNALVVYIIHFFLIEIVHFALPETISLGLVIMGFAGAFAIIYLFALFLEKKKLVIKL